MPVNEVGDHRRYRFGHHHVQGVVDVWHDSFVQIWGDHADDSRALRDALRPGQVQHGLDDSPGVIRPIGGLVCSCQVAFEQPGGVPLGVCCGIWDVRFDVGSPIVASRDLHEQVNRLAGLARAINAQERSEEVLHSPSVLDCENRRLEEHE